MVEVKMRVDDDVDVFGSDAGGVKVVEQFGGLLVDLHQLVGKLVADTGFDQDIFVPGADEQRIQSGIETVLIVGRGLFDHMVLGTTPKKAPPSRK